YSWLAFGIGLLLLNAVLFVPFLKNLFEVATLNGSQIGNIYLLAFIPTVIIQIIRVIKDFIVDRKDSTSVEIIAVEEDNRNIA
ncbi:MAG: hypothetical protein ACRC68_17395, partial [Clostridium sp.]